MFALSSTLLGQLLFLACISLTLGLSSNPDDDTLLIQQHVTKEAVKAFRNASGALPYPYLVPAGPYNEQWDWDGMFMAVALSKYGAIKYSTGTFLNFLSYVNLTDGALPGCLTPSGASQTLYHAKPLIIQAALITARQSGNFTPFLAFAPQMRALLLYWNNSQRLHTPTGLHTWHDELETGADNLVFSLCPSQYSDCWSESQAYTLSSPDLMVWLVREYQSYAAFLKAWGSVGGGGAESGGGGWLYGQTWEEEAGGALAYVARLKDVIHERLWLWEDPPTNTRGMYVGYNVSTMQQSVHRTYQVAWPVWAGLAANESVKLAALTTLLEPDLWTPFGLRSTSSSDPRYNNDNIINPYSNWRGPVWVNVAAIMAFTLQREGEVAAARALGEALVHTLAQDLRDSGTWHECYNSANGTGLAAPGFLSWDTLGADLMANIYEGVDPFSLE
jgi:putative isomerase